MADANARRTHDALGAFASTRLNPQVRIGNQIATVVAHREPQRSTDEGWPGGVSDAIQSADENRTGAPLLLGDDVEAMVHAVGEVHVREARGTEHDPVARSALAVRRVRGGIIRIDLHLDNAPAQDRTVDAVADAAAQQTARHR